MRSTRIFVGVAPFRPVDVSVFPCNSVGERDARRLLAELNRTDVTVGWIESTGTVQDAAAAFRRNVSAAVAS